MTFLDTMLQVFLLGDSQQSLRLPTRVTSIHIDPATHLQKVYTLEGENQGSSDPHSVHLCPCWALPMLTSVSP